MNNRLLLAAIASLSAPARAGGNPTHIHDDIDADPNDDAGGPRELSSLVLGGGLFGGSSSFEVQTSRIIPDGGSGSDVGAAVFESGTGVAFRGEIRWDNDDAGLALDAAALGLLGFELDFWAVDQDFDIRLTIEDGSGQTTRVTRTIEALDPGFIRTDFIALSEFDLTGFDASDVDAIEIQFNPREGIRDGVDFALTEFRAVVPTPGSAVLIGVGGLVAMRRRR
ncbi:MAG: hypothetical protein AAGA55_01735 [Planctomycetota bacterium]